MLGPRELARILSNRLLIRQGRTVQVALVYRSGYGGQTALPAPVILKNVATTVPSTMDQQGRVVNEYLAEFDLAYDPSAIAYIALTGGAIDDASIAAAQALEVLSFRRSGLVADRWQLSLRRFR